jgi:hypothetical protein
MNILFFVILTCFLMVVQTIVLPSFFWFNQCFDTMIIMVLFLSLISRHYSMIIAIVLIGCIMDSVSGVPFFFHVFSYLWVYIIVDIVKQLLFKQSIIFILIISIVSVLIQHAMLFLSVYIQNGHVAATSIDFGLLLQQVFWGFVIIPPGIWTIRVLWYAWRSIIGSVQKQIVRKYRG